MKRKTWRTHHRWFGLILTFFILLCFAYQAGTQSSKAKFGGANTASSPPKSYRYDRWNQGLLRGTLRSGDSVLIYGNGGIWQTDSMGRTLAAYSRGLPTSMEHRNIRGLVRAVEGGMLFAAATLGLYSYDHASESWVRSTADDNTRGADQRHHSTGRLVGHHREIAHIFHHTIRTIRCALRRQRGMTGEVSLFGRYGYCIAENYSGLWANPRSGCHRYCADFPKHHRIGVLVHPSFLPQVHAHTRAWLYKWHNTIGKRRSCSPSSSASRVDFPAHPH